MSKTPARALGARAVCAAALLTAAGSAWSAPNKCTGKDGKVTYTEQPCAQNQTQATVKVTAAPSGASGQRKGRLSPEQQARCTQARAIVDSLRKEIANEKHKNKVELLATARQQIAEADQLLHAQCD